MTERTAVFSLKFDSRDGKTDTVYVRLPVQVGIYVNVSDACKALAKKLGLDFCCTESQFDGNID